MGYQHKPRQIRVVFDGDSPYSGFEATLAGLTIGEYLEVIGVRTVDTNAVGTMIERCARALIAWNLEDAAGTLVPATEEAFHAQDKDLMLKLSEAWVDAIHGVSAPLEQSSPDGGPSLEASIPMADLSPSPAS